MESLKISKLYKDLDLNLNMTASDDFAKKVDVAAVKQALKTLILTNYYERPFYPRKGANLRGLLFENLTPITANAITKVIENLIDTYEQRVVLQNVIVDPLYDQNAYSVELNFYVRNIDKPGSLTLELQRLR